MAGERKPECTLSSRRSTQGTQIIPIKRDVHSPLSSDRPQTRAHVAAGQVNPGGNWRDQKGSAALGPITCNSSSWEEGVAPANYKAIAAFPGNEEATELLWGIQVDSDHNQKLPLPLCICKPSSPAAITKALYSCQVSTANVAETSAGPPAGQEHRTQGENGAAASRCCRHNLHQVPARLQDRPCGVLKSSRQKGDFNHLNFSQVCSTLCGLRMSYSVLKAGLDQGTKQPTMPAG